MKRYIMIVVFLAAFCMLGGCDDDNGPTCPEPPVDDYPIAQFSFTVSHGFAEPVESYQSALGYDTFTFADSVATVVLRDGDAGIRRFVDAENCPNFRDFCEVLTNGEDDNLAHLGWRIPSGSWTRISGYESGLLGGGMSGDMNPDLAGAQITRLMLTIESVVIDVPGHDPNGDGNWTDADFTVSYMVFGVL